MPATQAMTNHIIERRIGQIQFWSHLLRRLSAVPRLFAFIKAARELPILRGLLVSMIGYHRPFPTLKDAAAALSGCEGSGHSDPDHARLLMLQADKARPSDYPALFHVQRVLPLVRSIFDFGGNVGNLFYCYSKYLDIPSTVTWTVYDLPGNIEVGQQLADECGDRRLRFTCQLSDAEGIDLFVASGSLHYFDRPLPDIIAEFRHKPRYILINRTPLVDGPAFATIQDGGTHRVACMLYNRDDLARKFAAIGYELLDSWSALERSLIVPCYPDRSVPAYSGMFFSYLEAQPSA
jgi:putative methyltransferase (TIGR04325 family)